MENREKFLEELAEFDDVQVLTLQPSDKAAFKSIDKDAVELGLTGKNPLYLRGTIYEKAVRVCGIPATYAKKTPIELITPHLDYWFREFPFVHLVYNDKSRHVVSINRTKNYGVVPPAYMYNLLEKELGGLESGLVLDKPYVSEADIHFALVTQRGENLGTPQKGDILNVGFKVKMSPLGEYLTSVGLYLYRLVCSNGAISPLELAKLTFRQMGSIEDWIKGVVSNLFEAAAAEYQRVRALQDEPVANLGQLLIGLFSKYRLPGTVREGLTNAFLNLEVKNMYDVYNGVTAFANTLDLSEGFRNIERVQTFGGYISSHKYCEQCGNVLQ